MGNFAMILDKIKLHIRSRSFSCPFCYTFLDSDKIIVRETTPVTKESGLDPEQYHLIRQQQRGLLFKSIIKDMSSKEIYFCSIGSGFAGEEFLIKDDVRHMTLIEPDSFAADFLRNKFGNNASIVELPYQNSHPKEPYDIIYTSSLGSWMMSNPFLGVERDLLKFCQSYLKEEGVFIALIYGGLHQPGYLLDKRYYIDNLVASLKQYNFHTLLYGKTGADGAILVASKRPSIHIENIKNYLKEVLVENGQIKYKKNNLLINLYNIFVSSVWNILFMFKKLSIIIKETIKLIKINIKLIN
jgi:hypothetical protein